MKDLDKIKNTLSKKYEVLCFIDIADLADSPGKTLKLFRSLYCECYDHNQRIILYSSYHIENQFIEHIYEFADFVDISNFFILFVTKENIQEQLDECCQTSSNDSVSFQNIVSELPDTKKINYNFRLPDTICAIPWTHLEITNNGDISPCCMSSDLVLGNILDTKLTDAFYSDKMQDFRNRFLNGEQPKECKSCWKLEEKNLSSIRTHNIKRLKEKFLTSYLDNPSIISTDIKFGNACNFKCRICNSKSSSLFAQEEHKYKKIPLVKHNLWEESQTFFDQITELLPQLENIDMFGGEPFLIKKFKNVLQLAIDNGHSKNIRLHYNSNGSIWPKEFVNLWPEFKEVDILFSIDNVGKRFELERGGRWEDVENNILELKNLKIDNLKINLMPSIGAMNIYYIDELYDWAKKHGLNLYVSHVSADNGLDLSNLTKDAQQLIIKKYKNHPWSEIKNLINLIESTPPDDGKLFCETIRWFDTIRQENFAKTHPEIAQAMGYTV
jgi:radical SAM protein with 4Fe4S-binding SPASM domain